jgi:hypothetical protein
MTTPAGGPVRVFINYRRGDTRHVAGRLRDLIVARFGPDSVFVDVESIEPGLDYVTAIDAAVGSCAVMLVLVGESWLQAVDDQGRRRIDDPADRLRLEIEAGLRHETRVIPVLVDSATMPKSRELPPELVPLSRHQATRLRHDSFHSDAAHLLAVVERVAGGGPVRTTTTPLPKDRSSEDQSSEDRSSDGRSSVARWVSVGVLVVVLLALLGARSGVHDTVLQSRPQLASDGPWASLLWLLPAVPVALALWLMAVGRRPGVALGCVVGALLWVLTSLVFVEWLVDQPAVSGHVLLLLLLLAAAVGVVVSAPELREAVRGNTAGRAVPALLLLVVAVVLRVESAKIAQLVATPSDTPVDWSGPLGNPTILLSVLIPVLICLPAAVARGNQVQVSVLVTLAWLQILYPVLVRPMLAQGDDRVAALVAVDDVAFLAGCVCILLSVRAGQPRR